jgi:hypothetical protein
MHALFLAGLIVPFIIALAMAVISGMEMKAFVAEVQVMRTAEQLARFKRLAARNMYGALLQILLFIVPWGVYIFGLSQQVLRQGEVVIIFVLSIVTFLVSMFLKKDEEAARALRVEDPDLRAERDRVVKTWMHKAFPDW